MKYMEPSNNHTGSEYMKRDRCLDGEFRTASPVTNVRKIVLTLGLGLAGMMFSHPSARLVKAGELPKRVNTVSISANATMITNRKIRPVVRDTSAASSNWPSNNRHGADRAANATPGALAPAARHR